MSQRLVQLRALKGFVNGNQFVRRGGMCRRTRKVADSLIQSGYAEEVLSPLDAMVHSAKTLGVGLVIADGTKHADEIVKEAARRKVGLVDQRTPKPEPKPKAAKGKAAPKPKA